MPSLPTEKGEPTLAAVTKGLQAFVGREIEFQPSTLPPVTIADRVIGTSLYLLSRGPVLQDGNTLGVSAQERIRVVFAKQGRRAGVPVAKLTLEHLHVHGSIKGPGDRSPTGLNR